MLNIQNNCQYCFLYSIVAALHPAVPHKNPNKITSCPHFSQILKYDGIEFPINLRDIQKFVNMNNLSITIFTLDSGKNKWLVPLCLRKNNFTPRINLLLLQCNNDDDDMSNIKIRKHFALIQNLSRLVCQQTADVKKQSFFVNAV